jgi:hypothetical protein
MHNDHQSSQLDTIHAQITAEFEYLEEREKYMRKVDSGRFRFLVTMILIQAAAFIAGLALVRR